MNLFGVAYERGFFCNDESLMHPYNSDTVTMAMLVPTGVLVPLVIVSEFLLHIWCERRVTILSRCSHIDTLIRREMYFAHFLRYLIRQKAKADRKYLFYVRNCVEVSKEIAYIIDFAILIYSYHVQAFFMTSYIVVFCDKSFKFFDFSLFFWDKNISTH